MCRLIKIQKCWRLYIQKVMWACGVSLQIMIDTEMNLETVIS